MKKVFAVVALWLTAFSAPLFAQGDIIRYEPLVSYSIPQLDSIVNAFGAPQGLINIEYAVDIYKVWYTTPYKHPDSLVQVTGAVAFPVGYNCDPPLGCYMHGTASNRTNVPSYQSSELLLGVLGAAQGYALTLPDYLGLGDSDTTVPVHPYINEFSQANTSLNSIRAALNLMDTLGMGTYNDQLFLFGYSQGGFSTVATQKLIEQEYSNEFTITASAPMSGAFDLIEAQTDLIVSDSVYATPGYLPYIFLSYLTMYDNLAAMWDIEDVLVPPYDTLIPPLFYSGTNGIGYINGQCEPVPRDMVDSTIMADFENDSLHPFRLALAENDLIRGWVPQVPTKLFYCNGDEQVTYLNSVNAYNYWNDNGAPSVEMQDYGDLTHGGCIQLAMLGALSYFNTFKEDCLTGIAEAGSQFNFTMFPNPAQQQVQLHIPSAAQHHNLQLRVYDLSGKVMKRKQVNSGVNTLNISGLSTGMYHLQVLNGSGMQVTKKLVIIE